MKINKELLHKIAHLARIDFDEKSEEAMIQDMTHMLDWVEKLNELDTDGVEPLTTMSHEVNVLREDGVTEHMSHERAMLNAPKRDVDYFRVPKVLE